MKNIIKKLSVLTLVLTLCLSLCSCKALDQMKKGHAVYSDENQTELIFAGSKYKLVKDWPAETNVYLANDGTVSEKDVPVLLSGTFGEMTSYDNEMKIVRVAYSSHYCREDIYDEVISFLKNKKLDYLCTVAYNMDTDLEECQIIEKEGLLEAIEAVIELNDTMDEYPEIESFVSINKCDSIKLFNEWYVDINKTADGEFLINCNTDIVRDEDSDGEGEEGFYRVPKEYYKLFDEIIEEYGESLMFW